MCSSEDGIACHVPIAMDQHGTTEQAQSRTYILLETLAHLSSMGLALDLLLAIIVCARRLVLPPSQPGAQLFDTCIRTRGPVDELVEFMR